MKAVVVLRPGARSTRRRSPPSSPRSSRTTRCPAHWELRAELPRNATGKVLKHVLTGEAESTFVEE